MKKTFITFILLIITGLTLYPQTIEEKALFDACITGNLARVKGLLDRNIDPNTIYVDGLTPISIAVMREDTALISLLVRNGADLNMENPNYENPILWATKLGKIDVVKSLVSHRVNINSVDSDGNNSLMIAVKNKNMDLIKYFLNTSIRKTARNNNDDCVVLVAVKADDFDVFDCVLRFVYNVRNTDNEGRTPLIIAAMNGNVEIVRLLRKNMATRTPVDIYNKTALMYAQEYLNKSTDSDEKKKYREIIRIISISLAE